jgi:ribonuclease-3
MTPHQIDAFEAALGLTFHDPNLLMTALTHRSFVHENRNRVPELQHNERLEFLGDAVIEFISGEWLYQRFPEMREGELTRIRATLVRTETLAEFATNCGINDMIRLGPGEESNGGRTRLSILCDAFEAIVGALYLDQGIEAARDFIVPQFEPALEMLLRRVSTKDAKSRLQEWCHKEYDDTVPNYWVIAALGPAHDRHFMVEVHLLDNAVGWGSGRSIRMAQQAAAEMALRELGIDSRT